MASTMQKPLCLFCPLLFHLIPLLVFSVHVLATVSTAAVQTEVEEADALLRWKDSLDNQSQSFLSSWNTTAGSGRPCNWFGIHCNKAGSVTNISLKDTGLKGTLQSFSFPSFPNLVWLNLSNNSFHGNIPSHISNLSKLNILDLSVNEISGSIPQEIGMLNSLTYIDLSNNLLTGTIPPSIGNLTTLPILYIHMNQLSGSIPQELGMLKFVTEIDLSVNSLTGTIPASIGNLTNLSALSLNSNQLSGSIPREIGMLRSLTELALSQNNLTGPIPSSIGNLTALSSLYLSDNQLSNSIPREIGKLTKLTTLFLEINELSGTLPLEMNNFTLLEFFIVYSNRFTGQLPQDICVGGRIKSFAINGNNFSGGYGIVYKAVLPTGRVVAVKKLHQSQNGEMTDFKAFTRSNASLPAKLYWQSMLPNTPLPKVLKDLLQPDAGNRSAFSEVDVVAEPGTNSGRRATYGVGHWEENKKFEQKEIFNTTTIYFLQDGLHPDKKMKLTFTKSTNGSNFLPRKIAETLPFSSNKLPEILNYFAIEPTSKEAQILKHTIAECEAPSIRGEHKYCATSLIIN
ncbi:hypothetical protein GH714_012203 [Hevea brasiliensis]|uniref:BURP domain-containing protein n=1 Tax=Hevea brasiliensis TaxID=3981 RepID=A0A6A6KL24_HEVBR|nr:hypothetical protein GH714_012203 [Hevea brasiliensis]